MPPNSHNTVQELFDALDRLKKSKCQSCFPKNSLKKIQKSIDGFEDQCQLCHFDFLLFNHRYRHPPSPSSLPDWEVVHSLLSRAAVRIGRCQAEQERLGGECIYGRVLWKGEVQSQMGKHLPSLSFNSPDPARCNL